MATYFTEPSRTFGEYLLVPGYSSSECIPSAVSLKTPLVKYRKGQEDCPLSMNIPMVSAIMQSVSNDTMAIALAKEGGVSFIYGSQSVEDEAAMVARVKSYKKGFIVSDSNVRPDATLADILALKEKTGHSTVAVTDDGTANGKLLGIVASRDYRISRMSTDRSGLCGHGGGRRFHLLRLFRHGPLHAGAGSVRRCLCRFARRGAGRTGLHARKCRRIRPRARAGRRPFVRAGGRSEYFCGRPRDAAAAFPCLNAAPQNIKKKGGQKKASPFSPSPVTGALTGVRPGWALKTIGTQSPPPWPQWQ